MADMLTVVEVARMTNLSQRQVYGHIEAGNLKYINGGLGEKRKFYLIPREYYDSFIDLLKQKTESRRF